MKLRYEVKLTAQAIGQIEETVQYLSKILLEPEIARKWADILQCEIGRPDFMPSRDPLTEEEPYRTKGIRKMPVKNFLVYYLIDEEKVTDYRSFYKRTAPHAQKRHDRCKTGMVCCR